MKSKGLLHNTMSVNFDKKRRTSGSNSVANTVNENSNDIFPAKVSSGVTFNPHPKYWRIAGKYYDLSEFMHKHPGGQQLIHMAQNRFDDATFAFESHHHNFKKTRSILLRYYVGDVYGNERQTDMDGEQYPKYLLGDDAFYSVLRKRVTMYFNDCNRRDDRWIAPGPTQECVVLFWTVFVAWANAFAYCVYSGTLQSATLCAMFATWLGAFGHNWVHQPKYRLWATLSLDTVGFSSESWYRNHVLQHHMYTNTVKDNHFKGTDPFLITDPTVKRSWLQKHITPYLNPLILSFGMWGNYIAHTVCLFKGEEPLHWGKIILPIEVGVMVYRWGWFWGFALMYTMYGILGIYYFTLALMNHNAEHCSDVQTRNEARDWGEAQLNSSADWGVDLSFFQSIIYLWLNYHTVHHLFPHVDMSRHMGIQAILMKTCKEFGIKYVVGNPASIWKQMVHNFSTPRSLLKSIRTYSGAI